MDETQSENSDETILDKEEEAREREEITKKLILLIIKILIELKYRKPELCLVIVIDKTVELLEL